MSPWNWADITTALCRFKTKLRYPKVLASHNQGPPFLLHFGSTVTATLVSWHRHCKLWAARRMEENTATWWKKRIGNICNCSKYKYFHRDVPSPPIPSEFLNSMAGAAPPVPPATAQHGTGLPPQPHLSQCQLALQLQFSIQKRLKETIPLFTCVWRHLLRMTGKSETAEFQTQFSFASLLLFSNPHLSWYTGMAGITFYLYFIYFL